MTQQEIDNMVLAQDKARDKIWALEGYLLRERLYAQARA